MASSDRAVVVQLVAASSSSSLISRRLVSISVRVFLLAVSPKPLVTLKCRSKYSSRWRRAPLISPPAALRRLASRALVMPLIAEAMTIWGLFGQRLTMFATPLKADPSLSDEPPNFITVTWVAKSVLPSLLPERNRLLKGNPPVLAACKNICLTSKVRRIRLR